MSDAVPRPPHAHIFELDFLPLVWRCVVPGCVTYRTDECFPAQSSDAAATPSAASVIALPASM